MCSEDFDETLKYFSEKLLPSFKILPHLLICNTCSHQPSNLLHCIYPTDTHKPGTCSAIVRLNCAIDSLGLFVILFQGPFTIM